MGVPSWVASYDAITVANVRVEIDLNTALTVIPVEPFTIGADTPQVGAAPIEHDYSAFGWIIGDSGPNGTLGQFSLNAGDAQGLPAASWLNITADVLSIKTQRGGPRRVTEAHNVGQMSLVLDNRSRQWDPLNLLGPHVRNGKTLLRPGRKIRVVADWANRTFPLAVGWVQEWPVTYSEPGYSTVALECLGAFSLLAKIDPPAQPTYGTGLTFPDHLLKILELAYLPFSLITTSGAGNASLQGHEFAGNCLSTAHRVMASEAGELVERNDGAILARSRTWRTGVASTAVLTDDTSADTQGVPVWGVEPRMSPTQMINVVWGARVGGTSFVTTDFTSAYDNGAASTRRDDLLCQYDSDVQAWADSIIAKAANATVDIRLARVEPVFNAAASWLAVTADLGQKYTVRRRPLKGYAPGTELIERDVWVEGVEHEIDFVSGAWNVTLPLSDGGKATSGSGRFILSGTTVRGSQLSGSTTRGGALVGATSP